MQGQSDSPLSETGARQAHSLAQRLRRIAFSTLYSSDSGRARETARSVAALTGHDVIAEPRLRERHFGVFEGLTGTEIKLRFPDDYARFKSRDPDFVVPGGESAAQFRARVLGCLREIAGRHAGDMIVVVTHGLVLDMVYRAANGIALTERRTFSLINASLNQFRFDGESWHAETWGDASHLDEELLTSA